MSFSNKLLCRSVAHDSQLCTKITGVSPYGGKQLLNHKVDKVREVTDDSLLNNPITGLL